MDADREKLLLKIIKTQTKLVRELCIRLDTLEHMMQEIHFRAWLRTTSMGEAVNKWSRLCGRK